ncbi:unnamed protein product [Acanthosepion pharaonis]|uniref:Uncharacterized protein n=1 Tax=Acanthosepion pharaonis TaxID=158019 RepID=A0A812CL06_ACAPH|nr:unnamed protein product [Sepia pharaonis]
MLYWYDYEERNICTRKLDISIYLSLVSSSFLLESFLPPPSAAAPAVEVAAVLAASADVAVAAAPFSFPVVGSFCWPLCWDWPASLFPPPAVVPGLPRLLPLPLHFFPHHLRPFRATRLFPLFSGHHRGGHWTFVHSQGPPNSRCRRRCGQRLFLLGPLRHSGREFPRQETDANNKPNRKH